MNETNTGVSFVANTTIKTIKENTDMNTTNSNKEKTTMNTMNTMNTANQPTPELAQLVFQDMPHMAQRKSEFPHCKSAKAGNLFYPVIANDNLMEHIVSDENIVAAACKVKRHAFNPSGSEHGIVKKACDLIINYPNFRQIIRQNLLKGIYCPEGIVFDHIFKEKNMVLPRGFKYTVNQIAQTMVVQIVEVSGMNECAMPHAWSGTHNPGIGMMFETVDHIRAEGFKYWISLRLKSFLTKIPHDRLTQKIKIMFQDKRVADVVCALMGLNVSAADGRKGPKNAGISEDSPLANMLAYDLYLSALDQEIMRLGLTHVRYDDEIVVFCDTYTTAEQLKRSLVAFVKDEMKCSVDYNRTRIKDIAHLAFHGLSLQGGRWRMQYSVKNAAASDYLVAMMAYPKLMDDSLLWNAYRNLTKFINTYEGVYALENEIQRLKKWRDDHFTSIIAFAEKVKLGIVKLPD